MFNYLKKFNFLNESIEILKNIKRKNELRNSLKFYQNISNSLNQNPLISLDIGASNGFNTEEVFNKKYNKFFDVYSIEPIQEEFNRIDNKQKSNLGFWSEDKELDLYITDNIGATSVLKPNLNNFQFIYQQHNSLDSIRVKKKEKINCIRIDNFCDLKNINEIDFIKIDTQGSEYEILSGLGKYRPLLIRSETQTIECYENMNTFERLIDLLDQNGYVALNFEQLDNSVLKTPIFMDIIFIPKFQIYYESLIIKDRKNKFISLLQIFGLEKYLKLYSL